MEDLKLKSSLISNYKIESSLLPITNSLLTSSNLLNGKLTTAAINTERKTKLNTDLSSVEVKKAKLDSQNFLTTQKINLTSNLSSIPLSSKLNLRSNSTSHSVSITVQSLAKLNNLNLNSTLLAPKTSLQSIDTPPKSVKRNHNECVSSIYEDKESHLQEEYLKTESLINELNNELKDFEKEFRKNKRLKLSKGSIYLDNSRLKDQKSSIIRNKNTLINAVSSSLLKEPNFKNPNDPIRNLIFNIAENVLDHDPEFILKLALYTRKELNIRVTANFLLCFAAFKVKCRPYLQKYFKNSIVLPSDWIDVAEQYQLFLDNRLNFGALPNVLRKSMVEKFPDFDRYQLAKYNKEKSRLAKNNQMKDVKHIKCKIKDSDGTMSDITEHKYIKSVQNGLQINDRIIFEITYTAESKNLRFDIINRIQVEESNSKSFKKVDRKNAYKSKNTFKKDESNDKVACRISIDFEHNKIVVKNFLQKVWSDKNDVISIPSDCFTPNNKMKFYIDVLSNKFTFGVLKDEKDFKILNYLHNKHNIGLNNLNVFRISGTFFKLNDLKIFSKDKIHLENEQNDEDCEIKVKQRSFTLKQLIRQLHISSPIENVMSLLGKKYPHTFEDFMLSKLPGIFDSEKAGKRMKLEIPETWETQISLKGNKSEVWEQLIDNKKLPYMAMLRNLRNMIKTGISEKHHQWVLKKLQDEGAVIHSKQFPFRFFTAYEVLDELEQEYSDYLKWQENPPIREKKNKKVKSDINYDPNLLKRYKTALDNALKVATTFNISPIQGSTVIILNLSREMDITPGRAGKSLGKRVTSISEMAALLALMFKYSCENSKLIIFANSFSYTNIELEQGTILDNMKSLIELKNCTILSKEDTNMPRGALLDLFNISQVYDNIICLSNGIKDVDFFKEFLRKYRVDKNENLLFVNVNLAVDNIILSNDPNFDHENDINISGFSDAILRFVAERGNKGQLTHIEHIDKAYDLPELNEKKPKKETIQKVDNIEKPKFKLYVPKQAFKTVKVFISSTFRDMHSERDILIRTVFPLLRSKLTSLLINIYEIDLRWGITESEAESNETLDLCLNQVLNSDYFINILGARYGHVLENYSVRKNPYLEWLNNYPLGASITELEIETQLKKVDKSDTKYETTFFYFRDNSFINHVPGKYQDHFVEKNDVNIQKLTTLKSKIRKTNYEIFDGYKCKWLKCEESNGSSRALLSDLDSFAHRVFNNLFNSILKHHKNDVSLIELDEINHFNNLTDAFIKLNSESFIGRGKLLAILDKVLDITEEQTIIKFLLLNGNVGSGKTSLLSHYVSHTSSLVHRFIHMVGAYPGSENITLFLKRFCITTNRIYNFGYREDELDSNDYNFYKKCFGNILKKLCDEILKEKQKFYIIIDGIDLLLDDNKNIDYSFDWLPSNIQSKVVFIFSARSDSPIKSSLNKISFNNTWTSKLKLEIIDVENLDILDKSEFIKSKLAKFNKHLDENPFNNQIKMLTTKKDSVNPLYLTIVCEELRTHNQYETLNQKLKEIPIRINQLLNYVIDRLEKDFGQEFVSMAFNFISASRDGLNEQELKSMLTLYFKIKSLNFIDKFDTTDTIFNLDRQVLDQILNSRTGDISTAKFLSFLESISDTFLKIRSKTDESSIQIRSNNYIENSLRAKYSANKSVMSPKFTNKIIALFYWSQVENGCVNKWVDINQNQRGLTYLTFHLIQAEVYQDLTFLLTNIPFLALKCELGLSDEIMNDFDLHQDFKSSNIFSKLSGLNSKKQNVKLISELLNNKKLDDYKTFIQSSYHLLNSNSSLFYQQIFNQSDESLVLKDLKNLLTFNPNFSVGNLIEWINKEKQTDKYKIYPITIKDFDESISSISMSPDGALVACGTKNCQIKLYSTNTAKLIRNLQGHSGNINSIKFIGKDILCSTSSDGKACIWNVEGGFRIKVLDKHNGHVVKDACADPSGKNLVTVGWDCSAKIWNSINGNLEGELKGHPRPINCVSFNPDGTLVATGCWDSCIRIYNLYDRVRKAVLRGHNSSIRSIGYSYNGVYLASASIDGDVKLWNSKYGSQIGTLKGHSMPVNSISFSPNSQFLATGSSDRRVKIWSGTIGKMIRVINTESKKPLTSIHFYKKTGELFAVGTHEGDVFIYEIHGILKNKYRFHKAFITRIRFSQDGNFVISSCSEGNVIITNISHNHSVFRCAELKGSSSSVNALAINYFNVIATGAEDCAIRIYPNILDKIKEKTTIKLFEESPTYTLLSHSSPITSISFNKSGDKFASSSKDALIIVWEMNHINFEVTEMYRINNAHLDWITDLEWSNSSDFILTSSNDNTLKIWNAQNGKENNVLTGHNSNINSCAFQYGCAVSTSFDGSIKIWSHKGNEISTLLGHQGRVNSCDLFIKLKVKEQIDKRKIMNENEEMEISSLWSEEVEKEMWLENHNKKLQEKQQINVEEVYLITCSDDSTIRIWKPIESDYLLSIENHNNSINSVYLDQNFNILTASSDKTINLWNTKKFFDMVKAGLVMNQDESNKAHFSEITAICCDQKKQFLLSASFDGKVIVWKFTYSDSIDINGNQRKNISNIKFIQEIKAHEKSCNSICIINESDEEILFATSSIDKSIKVWNIDKKNSSSQIQLVQNFYRNLNEILYINIILSQKDKYLIVVEKEATKILIRKNKLTQESRLELSSIGFCILNFPFLINGIKLIESKLYITIPNDQIFEIDMNLTSKKLEIIDFKNSEKRIPKIISSFSGKSNEAKESEAVCYCSITKLDDDLFIGDSKGNLYNFDLNSIKMLKNIHDSKITNIISFKNKENRDHFLTSSQDGTIKVWTEKFEKELGKFHNSSKISAIESFEVNEEIIFLLGDQMGNMKILKWYD